MVCLGSRRAARGDETHLLAREARLMLSSPRRHRDGDPLMEGIGNSARDRFHVTWDAAEAVKRLA
jgi:hypothetical protein